MYMCHVSLQASVEVCVCICVKLVYSFCGGLCVYMCHVSLQASVEVCVYLLMREVCAEGLMGQQVESRLCLSACRHSSLYTALPRYSPETHTASPNG